jgi:ketosteroid isomerase-like protein
VAEALIRQRIEDAVKALRAKDIDGVTSLYAPNIVSFDIVPPLRYVGAHNKRRAWEEAFAAYTGPFAYEVHDFERHDARGAGLRS